MPLTLDQLEVPASQLVNEESTGLLSIGEFARRSNLSVSALRFYGDGGVLVPTRTDSATGYRYYSPDQLRTAELLRQLRALQMPVAEIQFFLTADPADAEALLDRHWRHLRRRFERSRQAFGAAKALLRSKEIAMSATTRLDGSELASAVRQVLPAAGPIGKERHYPAALLVELTEDGLRLVATDGHRLAVRDLPAQTVEQGRMVISAEDAGRVASLVDGTGSVALTAGRELAVQMNAETVAFAAVSDDYPDYEAILRHFGSANLLVKTADLLGRLDRARNLVVLNLSMDETSADGVRFPGRYRGDDLMIGFSPSYLADALGAGIGPDVIMQLGSQVDPVALRSADDGTLTWLVMPIRLEEPVA